MLELQLTADGSWTFFSPEFDELFHSHQGAKQEAEQKFVETCKIRQKAEQSSCLRLLDICYGLGYNSAAALNAIWSVNPDCRVELIALEINEEVPRQAVLENLLTWSNSRVVHNLAKLAQHHHCHTPYLEAKILLGDARNNLPKLKQEGFQADAIFLDPFSPPKCPQLWTVEFLALVADCLDSEGRLATYSCAASVRTALQLAGLYFGSTPSVGRRSPGTIALKTQADIPPISEQEKEHLKTRAGIPYRDPLLQDSPQQIRERRIEEQKFSILEPTSHWKKRWLFRSSHS
ncbi:tRNA (5-methylaminomethyl-2-thiouridine)(34)-methyltransferase MnmD [Gloeocapsa sp. PCC 73106]|uniref:tRNA (5-methylaminomethyl-2-thiouridine)(34)-methyltransferase MnmD n=1 Tax=Gloeocapsa sp. PCC 73106 TaxID=102232 RepID=UPI0002ABC288|nr:MnmC family methyltransferase [Gloeocapsa sp. PCC 73106]ELR96659.1 hypothetical protein GLO73106DRAFT_00004550 [Gloeocapsa sp. PCC 73106]